MPDTPASPVSPSVPPVVEDRRLQDLVSAAPTYTGVRKNPVPKLNKVRAAQLKPCDRETIPGATSDSEPIIRPLLVYVTAEGRQVTIPCTAKLTEAVAGGRLDMIDDSDFIIYIDRKTDTAIRVEALKRQRYERGLVPVELENVKLVEFDVDLAGGFASVKAYPAKVDADTVLQMKNELDDKDHITPGDKLLGRYPIVDVRGGIGGVWVTVNPFVK